MRTQLEGRWALLALLKHHEILCFQRLINVICCTQPDFCLHVKNSFFVTQEQSLIVNNFNVMVLLVVHGFTVVTWSGWGIHISGTALYGPMLKVFHIFSGRDLSNGKSLIINPQSHTAHYFCHLREHSTTMVQDNRGITLRNYKKTPTLSTC